MTTGGIFWDWIALGGETRPLLTTPTNEKDADYDNRCARYYLSTVHSPYRDFYLENYASNVRYAAGGHDSWGETQDVREFLGDTDHPTGRLALKNLVLQPMLTRLMGAADGMSITAGAEATTVLASTRREQAMAKMLIYSKVAQAGPIMAEAYSSMGVSPDEGETVEAFEANYRDEYVRAMNALLTMMGRHQRIAGTKRQAASNVALSGLFAWHTYTDGQHVEGDLVRPDEVGWDTSCRNPDFSDGEFCYTSRLMDIPQIGARYQASKEAIEKLDKWAHSGSMMGDNWGGDWPQKKPRVFTVYYKDRERVTRGYVVKEGAPHYCTIGVADPDKRGKKPEYTEKDLIEPPDNKYTATWTEKEIKERKQVREVVKVRYCTLIPWEYLPGAATGGLKRKDRKELSRDKLGLLSNAGDLVLESGCWPYQPKEQEGGEVMLPISFQAWSLLGGLVMAPLSAARDPQRMKNMVVSDMVYRMERAGVPTTILDSDATAGATVTQGQVIDALKDGKPVFLKGTLVGGVQNAVSQVNTGPGHDFYAGWGILEQLDRIAQAATGIYDQNFGAPGSPNQLVGVKQLQLQQSSVMLRPFNAALLDGYEQVYRMNAQVGKRFYAARPWILSQWAGDMGAMALSVAKDLDSEDFRVTVRMTLDDEQRKKEADMMILGQGGYLDRGLLDNSSAAQLLGRSYPEDVNEAARLFAGRMQQQAQMQAQAQAQAAQQAAFAQQEAINEQEQKELDQQKLDVALENKKLNVKRDAPYNQALSQWSKPMGGASR